MRAFESYCFVPHMWHLSFGFFFSFFFFFIFILFPFFFFLIRWKEIKLANFYSTRWTCFKIDFFNFWGPFRKIVNVSQIRHLKKTWIFPNYKLVQTFCGYFPNLWTFSIFVTFSKLWPFQVLNVFPILERFTNFVWHFP